MKLDSIPYGEWYRIRTQDMIILCDFVDDPESILAVTLTPGDDDIIRNFEYIDKDYILFDTSVRKLTEPSYYFEQAFPGSGRKEEVIESLFEGKIL